MILILFRDYCKTCEVVGIADGFGVAADPNGLDPDKLLRLVTVRSFLRPVNEFMFYTVVGCLYHILIDYINSLI